MGKGVFCILRIKQRCTIEIWCLQGQIAACDPIARCPVLLQFCIVFEFGADDRAGFEKLVDDLDDLSLVVGVAEGHMAKPMQYAFQAGGIGWGVQQDFTKCLDQNAVAVVPCLQADEVMPQRGDIPEHIDEVAKGTIFGFVKLRKNRWAALAKAINVQRFEGAGQPVFFLIVYVFVADGMRDIRMIAHEQHVEADGKLLV